MLFVVLNAGVAQAMESTTKTIRVVKSKGQRALVIFPNSVAPQTGETYRIIDSFEEGWSEESAFPQRNYTIDLSSQVGRSSTTAGSTSVATTGLAFDARFGLNWQNIELGPAVSILYAGVGTTSTSVIGFGGFVDFNFIENRPGTFFVPGVGVNAGVKIQSSTMSFGAGADLFLKVFVFDNATALKIALLGDYYSGKVGAVNVASMTLGLGLGLQVYF